jgi:4'-phosphopantetheinyl transferase
MPTLLPEELHIWSARQPSTLPPDLEAALSRDECARARRIHFPQDRLAYVFAHAVHRDVLSRYLDCSRDDIRFTDNPFGKPFLDDAGGGRALEFNLSHAGDLVLVGLCCGRRIGIDVEQILPMDDILAIAESYFTPQECAFIFGHRQDSGRESAFWSCWTRKEAYVKAVGRGLSIPLNSFDTLISVREPVVFLESGPASTDEAIWQVRNLDLWKGYMAAVAVETGINRLIYFEWTSLRNKQTEALRLG